MNHNYRYGAYVICILALALLNCGFTWGFGSNDQCGEARKISEALSIETPINERSLAENNILKLCPSGGAVYYLKGLALESDKNIAGAIEAYQAASEKDPLLAEAKGRLGLLLLQQSNLQEASVALYEAVQLKAKPLYARALADIFLQGKLYSLALQHYQMALPAFAGDVNIHIGMAQSYQGLGKQTEAYDSLQSALRLDAGNEAVHLELAGIYRARKQYDHAVTELRSAITCNPEKKETHYALAKLLELIGNSAESDKEYSLAGVERSITPADHLRKAIMFQTANEFDKEAAEYEALLFIQPEMTGIREKLGDARLKAGHDRKAITAYEEAIVRKEGSSRIFYNLGTLYERKGDLDEAIRRFSEAIRIDSSNSDARRRLAEIYTLRGDFAAAIGEYQELVARHRDNPLNFFKLARLLEMRKDYRQAINAYTKAIQLDQDNIEAQRGIALLYLKRKLPEDAAKHFREVLRLNPNNDEARNSLITHYVKKKRYDEATELLKEDARLNPLNPDSQYRLGIMYAHGGKNDDALIQFQEALKLKPDHARAFNAMGKIYLKTGYSDKAKDAFNAARKADPELLEPVELLSTLGVAPRNQTHSTAKKTMVMKKKKTKTGKTKRVGKNNRRK